MIIHPSMSCWGCYAYKIKFPVADTRNNLYQTTWLEKGVYLRWFTSYPKQITFIISNLISIRHEYPTVKNVFTELLKGRIIKFLCWTFCDVYYDGRRCNVVINVILFQAPNRKVLNNTIQRIRRKKQVINKTMNLFFVNLTK